MPKYLIQACYTAEGLRGLQKDKASGRKKAVTTALEAVGGRLEGMYFALGDDDVIAIIDLPDNATATGLAVTVSATGMIRTKTTALLTVEETDEALGKTFKFRPPGG